MNKFVWNNKKENGNDVYMPIMHYYLCEITVCDEWSDS